ncbi:IS110 family transposase [Flavobacterium cupreum]|uniref:Transposase n=2 Tax=Flavobacterium TaxID=237 RepID=A0A4Y7U5K0_9FLAO|nr:MULTISPECIES: transposase [Flavobacterium]RUT72006.1 IS110 family transposase [Flavobacterium cupreum]TCN49908.1 transposase [Flavobacterium circumlabens]TEB41707.1 IS110 family transposase [Flavobacterium circumlabens]
MKNYLFHAGIDISKDKLDINILDSLTLQSQHLIIRNDIKSISDLIKILQKKIDLNRTLFCCENTGVYTNHLSFVLLNKELDLWVVPAIEIKKSKGISRGKNDKTDSKDISYYSYRHLDKLNLFTLADVDVQKLKILFTERAKMIKALLIPQTSRENKEFTQKEIYKEISGVNGALLKQIKNSIKKIEIRIKEVIKSNDQLNKQDQLARSIPGIGAQTSAYLIIATKGFSSFDNWRKFACYSGVAPFEFSSGTSVRGKTKVNHMADKKMKSLLQMCVLTAIKYDPQLKEYYNIKKAEGKNSMLVMNNIRCKLISRVFAVISRGTPYINTYKFAS